MNDTFVMYTPGHGIPFAPMFPDSITYSDGRILNRLNLWSSLYVGDAGKSTENITMQGVQTSKTIINKIDEAIDLGLNFIIWDFNNDNIDGTWICESFSYTVDLPGGYSYSLSLERVNSFHY